MFNQVNSKLRVYLYHGMEHLDALYKKLGLDLMEISSDTPCRNLKDIVSPDYHTSKVREAVGALKKE